MATKLGMRRTEPRKPLKRKKGLNPTSIKTRKRNKLWKFTCLARANCLRLKYGYIKCEYSGETINILSSVPNSPDDGWGHHIDKNRENYDISNCYIVKYKYHSFIHDNNIQVKQEGFEGLWNTIERITV